MKLHLIEGNSAFFRAYHTIPPMAMEDGTPCNAIYGYCSMLYRMLQWHQGTHMAVVLDGPTSRRYRQKIYPAYKTNRKPLEDSLRVQLPWMRRISEAFGAPCLETENYEADDVIASVAAWWLRRYPHDTTGAQVEIVTIDKDFLQLLGPGISIYDPIKRRPMDEADALAKFGVPPHAIPEVQALMGDATDGIPGVDGIGKVIAAKLIRQFGSLDAVYDNLALVEPVRIRALLQEGEAQARLSRELVTLQLDVPVDMPLGGIARRPIDHRLTEFLRGLGFDALLKEMAEAG